MILEDKWQDFTTLKREKLAVVDCRGKKVPKVTAFEKCDTGIYVQFIPQNEDGEYLFSSVNEVCRATVYLERGKLERKAEK